VTEQPKTRRRKYRTNCNAKNMRQLSVRVSEEVHTFIEMHSYDEKGRKLSKAKVLENIIAFIGERMLVPTTRQKC
jgi:hypothetical protein